MVLPFKISFSRKQVMIVGVIVVVLVTGFFVIQANRRPVGTEGQVKLVVWGVDPKKHFETLFGLYAQIRPNLELTYQEVGEKDFRERLLSALAEGKGPDVVMIGSHDVAVFDNLLAPANPAQFPLSQFQTAFPTVAEQDFVQSGNIYAVPLFIDTLALFYNKDMFDQAGIAILPKTWEEFQALIPQLRRLSNGQLTRPAAAIGGSESSVAHAADLLQVLMLQNGAAMVDASRGNATFARGGKALEALRFYLQFANVGSPYYTWSDAQEKSLEAFAGGRSAMAFGYYADVQAVKKKSPFLAVGVAPLPQAYPEQPVSFAAYRGLAVTKQSKAPQWGWDFAIFTATNRKMAESYTGSVERPAALRELIVKAQNDPALGVFARQALTARSWPVPDGDKIKTIFDETLRNVLTGKLNAEAALRQAEDQVTQLLRK